MSQFGPADFAVAATDGPGVVERLVFQAPDAKNPGGEANTSDRGFLRIASATHIVRQYIRGRPEGGQGLPAISPLLCGSDHLGLQ